MDFPGGKRFCFSILDDTDDATVVNVKPVYDHLFKCGLRTTKTVWPMDCPEGSRHFFAAETLQDKSYCAFVHELVSRGFEVALHGATMESSPRERTLRGLQFLQDEFALSPRLHCNHAFNKENLYWGLQRLRSPLLRAIFRLVWGESGDSYEGAKESSPFFWGDRCLAQIDYVRNFTFTKLNMLEVNPEMPYRRADTAYVKYWFSTADVEDVDAFNRHLTVERIDELEARGAVCIISTHLGKGYARNGKLNAETAKRLEYLGAKAGWFAPVSEVLDHLRSQRQRDPIMTWMQTAKLEYRYFFDKVFRMLERQRRHVRTD